MTLSHWRAISEVVYYSGMGCVLVGTAIRFLYNLYMKRNQREKFVDEIQKVHLVNIYSALSQIAKHMGLELEYPHTLTRP